MNVVPLGAFGAAKQALGTRGLRSSRDPYACSAGSHREMLSDPARRFRRNRSLVAGTALEYGAAVGNSKREGDVLFD
jgi:hypothetical protein